jgi:hypothetical protein
MHTLTAITFNTLLSLDFYPRDLSALFFLNLATWPGVRYVYVRSRLNWFHRREEQDLLDVYMTM